ncbi:MAG: hypothetical protein AB7E30_06865 [Lawsonibacter sp.]
MKINGNEVGSGEKRKKKFYQKWWVWVLAVFVLFSVVGSFANGSGHDVNQDAGGSQAKAASSSSAQASASSSVVEQTPATQAYSAELSSGNYTAGVDFPAGTYDIVAVAGGGNVSSDNAYMGGINAILGVAEKNVNGLDLYEQEYSNIKLPEGVTLYISGVTISISSDDASTQALTPRNQDITDSVELGNGNFVAGTDFPAGVYDIVAISGGGNVSSDNAYGGGINAVLGTADKNTNGIDMYEQTYKNIQLTDGVTLAISGVKISLTPSK